MIASANSKRFALLLALVLAGAGAAQAQLLGEPPIPPKVKKNKRERADLEWMWQYSPPPADGREHELIQDPDFQPFLRRYFTAPQSFWGPAPTDPRAPIHKSLPDTIDDFLTIPGSVIGDENRYMTITGAVRRRPTSRGLIFADLNAAQPLVVFAAIDWIRESKTTDDPAAEYTLWLFPNRTSGAPVDPAHLPPPLLRSLTRWMAKPLPGSGTVQRITAAILVAPDGTPQQIPVPASGSEGSTEAPALPKRNSH